MTTPTQHACDFARIAYGQAVRADLAALCMYQDEVNRQEAAGAFDDQALIEEMWKACQTIEGLRSARWHEKEAWIVQRLAELDKPLECTCTPRDE